MGVKRHSWRQDCWKTPHTTLHRSTGDYDDLNGWLLHPTSQRLTRAPGWSTHVALPSGITNVQALTYDQANARVVLIGTDAATPTKTTCCYFDSDWTASTTNDLLAGITGLGGRYLQNIAWHGDYLYVIDANNDIHRGTAYTSTLTSFYTSSDAQILVSLEDRLYMLTTTGTIYRLNDANTGFAAYFTPITNLTLLYAAPFSQYLLLIGRRTDGILNLYRLYPSYTPSLDHLLPIALTGDLPTYACPWTVHNNTLILSTGSHTNPNNTRTFPLYAFTGQSLTPLAQSPEITGTVARWTVGTTAIGGPAYIGTTSPTETLALLNWRTYPLLAYAAGANLQLRAQNALGFPTFPAPTVPTPPGSFLPLLAPAGDHLILLGVNTAGAQGLYHAGPDTYHSPAIFTTSRFDAQAPGQQKHLNRLTAWLSQAYTAVTITIEYRLDNGNWVTALSTSNSTRPSVDLDVTFYILEIRLTLTDTGNHLVELLDVEGDYSL